MDNTESAEYKPASSQLPGQPTASDHICGLNMATAVADAGKEWERQGEHHNKRHFSLLTPSNCTHWQLQGHAADLKTSY